MHSKAAIQKTVALNKYLPDETKSAEHCNEENTMAINKNLMIEEFLKIYGGDRDGVEVFFAPGVVNLLGDHTDYNGGHVLPVALTLGTYAAIRRSEESNTCRVASAQFPENGIYEFPLEKQVPDADIFWVNYPMGSLWSLIAHGHRPSCGFDIYFDSTLPLNSGLSSSASIITVTIYSIMKMYGFDGISPIDLVLINQDAENSFLNVGCGVLGAFMSVFGKKHNAIYLKASSLHFKYTPLSLLGKHIVVTNSGIKHANMNELFSECLNDCRKGFKYLSDNLPIMRLCDVTSDQYETYKDMIPMPQVRSRVKHVVYENQRVMQAYNALYVGNITRFGKLMNDSHVSLRDDFGASCPEVDYLIEAAWDTPGVIGSRITGVGFGGCTVSIVENNAIENFIESVGNTYTEKTGRKAEFYIAETGDGAHEVTA